MSLALVGLLVAAITALTTDAIYTTVAWLIGRPSHPYQRPHHWRRYALIVALISTEVAVITVLAVVLVRTIVEPGLSL
jgi:hypothetical protein